MSIKNINISIREKHILGSRTQLLVVRCDDSDHRDWLADAPICSSLNDYRIAHCGIMDAGHRFEIVRMNLSGTFLLGCIEGEGQVLIDGNWQSVHAGQICVQPPFIPNAMKTHGRKSWKFCWVRYQKASIGQAVVSLHAPAISEMDINPVRLAIEGLHSEACHVRSPHTLRKWADLVSSYALSVTQPLCGDERLLKVWQAVECQLDEDWTLDRLAQIACVSKEHLRRLCTKALGRSPIQHVTFLRMQNAAELLATTHHKIAYIANHVGYVNQFAFSDTFQRWLGCRPSSYRKRDK